MVFSFSFQPTACPEHQWFVDAAKRQHLFTEAASDPDRFDSERPKHSPLTRDFAGDDAEVAEAGLGDDDEKESTSGCRPLPNSYRVQVGGWAGVAGWRVGLFIGVWCSCSVCSGWLLPLYRVVSGGR